jgi:hypothetical protein
MKLGFYSEFGRSDIVAARAFIVERGYSPQVEDIRCCRQDLVATSLRSLVRLADFFSTSECRDLLFHVQENRTTIPAIKIFIAEQNLNFIGFEFSAPLMQKYSAIFANAGWSMTDLDRWHAFETANPDTFTAMYQFWVQKT